tara:strand:- start:3943 stop:4863 length:921 start_codon:yes stop_codon:yes gene_type:complete
MEQLIKRITHLEEQINNLFIEKYIINLKENGYVIIPNVLNIHEINTAKQLFINWKNSIPNLDKLHNTIDPHGIFKFLEVGHQEFAWNIRTRPQIINIFKKIWNTDDLVVSFDGSCYISKDCNKKDKTWTHTDQAPNSIGLKCYQSFVSLTNNEERTLIVYEKSHLLHEKYFKERNISHSKNWNLIDIDYLNSIEYSKKTLKVNAGDLVIWDSRTFHQNQYGKINSEERLVQYLCYLPKNVKNNNKNQQNKRLKYFSERRTTSHWPYPLNVNGLQPQTYGDKSKLIDYSTLPKPNLDKYLNIIKTII